MGRGVRIHVRIDGRPDDPAVMLLHGYLGTGEAWVANVTPLIERGLRVIRPDHRGHGSSTHTADETAYTFNHLYLDTIALADALDLEQFHLVGHSMGGLVAQLVAIRDPHRLHSLVLVDCSPLPGRAERRVFIWLRRVVGYRLGAGRLVRLLTPVLMRINVAAASGRSPAERRAELAALAASVDQLDPAAFVAFGERLVNHGDVRPQLPAVTTPTTVVVGQNEIPKLRLGAEALVA
ncbi:MAG: alpha/beta hydrolase, partial [Actinomycetota bacterium]